MTDLHARDMRPETAALIARFDGKGAVTMAEAARVIAAAQTEAEKAAILAAYVRFLRRVMPAWSEADAEVIARQNVGYIEEMAAVEQGADTAHDTKGE